MVLNRFGKLGRKGKLSGHKEDTFFTDAAIDLEQCSLHKRFFFICGCQIDSIIHKKENNIELKPIICLCKILALDSIIIGNVFAQYRLCI